MSMDRHLISFFDEFEKLGVSGALSHFQQTRSLRRPISVETLLEKEKAFAHKKDEDDNPEDHKNFEVEGGAGMTESAEG